MMLTCCCIHTNSIHTNSIHTNSIHGKRLIQPGHDVDRLKIQPDSAHGWQVFTSEATPTPASP